MADGDIAIERVTEATEELEAALQALIPQLSSTPLERLPRLASILANPEIFLLVARDADRRVLGMLTLVTFVIPTGTRAIIEDVVVDESARGRGIGGSLVDEALQFAVSAGALTVDLTSRPSRVEANRLYERAGFVKRSTNVWRFSFG